jgi:hypothetical protein
MILELMDHRTRGISKAENDFRRYREAIVAAGHPDHKIIFPEFFQPKVEELGDAPLPDDAQVDYSDVEWKMPSNAKEEYEALMAQVSAHRSGSFGGEQLMDPDAGWR